MNDKLRGVMRKMIKSLYECFQHWCANGSIYIISDLHFDDFDCKLMDPDWITPVEQIGIINRLVRAGDTLICLGDVGEPTYVSQIKAKQRILLLGNHDKPALYRDYFDEIYAGPLFISDRILLSHEPILGLPWCVNIHGHDHSQIEVNSDSRHINLAANVCDYTPVNLGNLIKEGLLSGVNNLHRMTIDRASKKDIKGGGSEW